MEVVEIGGIGAIGGKSMAAEEPSSKCRAQIVGKVEFRQGEGMLFAIPLGAADVEVTALDTTFSWMEGNFHGLAAMPFVNFCHYITAGVINLDECSASADMQLALP
jgi:hypothetical protein